MPDDTDLVQKYMECLKQALEYSRSHLQETKANFEYISMTLEEFPEHVSKMIEATLETLDE